MAVTRHTYATREEVKAAAGWEAAADDLLADRLIESHSDKVDELFHRRFFPRSYTRSYDYPSRFQVQPGILWLDDDLLVVTQFTASGVVISSADYFLGPDKPDTEAYDRIELDATSTATFGAGGQRSLVVEGLWGYSRNTAVVGALAAGLNNSATALPAATYPALGVGDLLFIGSELIVVSDRAEVNEVDTLTLIRGAYGTTAASHLQGAAMTKNVPPGLIRDLVIAECIATRVQEDGGYNASIGPGGNGTPDRIALLDLRARAKEAYGRDARLTL
jgi:hypothetical protein